MRVGLAATFLALVFHSLLYADFLEDPMTWALLAAATALASQGTGGESGGAGESTSAASAVAA